MTRKALAEFRGQAFATTELLVVAKDIGNLPELWRGSSTTMSTALSSQSPQAPPAGQTLRRFAHPAALSFSKAQRLARGAPNELHMTRRRDPPPGTLRVPRSVPLSA